jgi:hypothetical protein
MLTQAKFAKRQCEVLAIRNEEIRRSVEDLVALVRSYPRENPEEQLDEAEVAAFMAHYSHLTYQAILQVCTPGSGTNSSLFSIAMRLTG